MSQINGINSSAVSPLDPMVQGLDPELMLAYLKNSIDEINSNIQERVREIKERNDLRKRYVQLKEDLEMLKNILPKDDNGKIKWDASIKIGDLPPSIAKYVSNLNPENENSARSVAEEYLAKSYPDLFGVVDNSHGVPVKVSEGSDEGLLDAILNTNAANDLTTHVDLRIQELTANDELEMLQLQSLVKKYDSIIQATSNVINQIYATQSAIIKNIG